MTAKRFMVDDCGTLIDMHTRDTFDYVSDVCDLLNELSEENQSVINWIDNKIEEIKPYNSELCRATLLELKEFLE